MYSRYQPNSREEPFRLPENYGGCAFSEPRRPTPPEPPDGGRLEIATPTPAAPSPPEAPPHAPDAPKKDAALQPTSLLSPLGHAFPFSHGLGFEELLILGLILLLARTDEPGDTLLWLVLLLFCG